MATKKEKRDARARGNHYGMNWIRKSSRLAIYLRDGMSCCYCAATIEDGARLTLDHLVPHSQGGSNRPKNLVTACHKCNSVRGDRDWEEFAADVSEYLGENVTSQVIIDAISETVTRPVKGFRQEAKEIIARRPSWQAALVAATERA